MNAVWSIARREFAAFFNSIWGYVVASVILVITGLMFNAFAMSDQARLSAAVLADFFYLAFGTTTIAAILLSMRLFAEERQNGTIVLIDSAPIADWQVVAGKYLAAMGFLVVIIGLTAYMPALIFVNGKVSFGQIAAGYLGLTLAGSATIAIGTFASTLSRFQLVSAVIGGVITVFLLITWLLAKIAEPPLDEILSFMSLFDAHFRRTFMVGRITTTDIVYFMSITFAFLTLSTRWLSARRWR